METRPTFRQQLVWVTLVPHVPDQAVVTEVVEVVQSNRQLDNAHTRTKVAAGDGDNIHDLSAHLRRKLRELRTVERFEVGRAENPIEQRRLGR